MGAVVTTALTASATPAQEPPPQPELVCDFRPVLAGTVSGDGFRASESTPRVPATQVTFRDIDPTRQLAVMVVGASGPEQVVAVAVEASSIGFLYELKGTIKALVTVKNKPDGDRGYPAVMSEHHWTDGEMGVRVLAGAYVARRPSR
jgi:hypothetical protein